MDERARIAMLARTLGDAAGEGSEFAVEIAIGDDAAVLDGARATGRRIVWTIDAQVEGTHFRRDFLPWRDVGWRSLMAAASDIAAMGAKPWCVLCALALPDDVDDSALEQMAVGQRDAALSLGAPVVGGNLARGRELSISTTLLGTCERAVTRSGARPGDALWLAGAVGLAAAGLRALETGRAVADPRLHAAVASWRTPRALVREGSAMAAVAHAAIDVSDGLARDVGQIAEASGVQIVLDERALSADDSLLRAAEASSGTALELALYGGEDYALVVASPVAVEGFRLIGEVREGKGLVLRGGQGERPIEPRGYDHFRVGRPRTTQN
jgi:thiamine-monophosphate kinase